MQNVLTRGLWLAAVLALFGATAVAAGAGNDFSGLTTTAGGYSTYDADQINSESAQTGKGVYVAVLDTGLVPNWRDYFPAARVAESLGKGFHQNVTFKAHATDPCGLETEVGELREATWVGSKDGSGSHGTHVSSTILGYFYRANADAAAGFSLPPIVVRGIAPDVTVIPVRVLSDYGVPARPKCTDPDVVTTAGIQTFGTDAMVAAGIDYVAGLAERGLGPIVINMSLGGDVLSAGERAAIDRAIRAGVIVVAAAGNDGENGMHFPGAYEPVISAGSSGWTREFLKPDATSNAAANFYRLFWLKAQLPGLPAGSGEVADPTAASEVFVSDFSSRELAGQDLDVLAPGNWVRGPFPGFPGYSHLPWWSNGIGDLAGINPGNFFYVGGTSMSSPHVAATAAMMLQKRPSLTQSQVEAILTSTALAIPSSGSAAILDFNVPATVSWDTDCDGDPCDPVGAGLIQADAALAAIP